MSDGLDRLLSSHRVPLHSVGNRTKQVLFLNSNRRRRKLAQVVDQIISESTTTLFLQRFG